MVADSNATCGVNWSKRRKKGEWSVQISISVTPLPVQSEYTKFDLFTKKNLLSDKAARESYTNFT